MTTGVDFVVYDTSTGQIVISGFTDSSVIPTMPVPAGTSALAITADPATEYIDTGTLEVTQRPALGTSIDTQAIDADAVDEATISSIPTGTSVEVTGPGMELYTATINDGTFIFTTEDPGTFSIILRKFPAQDEEYSIVAT